MARGLFDSGSTRTPFPPQGNSGGQAGIAGKPKVYTVGQITRQVKDCIERGIGPFWVEGELSNFKAYHSGHCYFTLKEEGAQLSAVIWRTAVERLKFMPEDGKKVLCFGRLSVYEPRGSYQMIVDRIEPLGIGDLAAAFEQLKRKLAAEGLFSESRKRSLPRYPRCIGIVTSPTGAAIQDLMKVIFARWPADLILAGVRVQGEGAAAEIVHAIKLMNRIEARQRPDVLIVGRGGGSLEDLWAFNEEPVARAIVASRIPIVSAVGHESDFTIADFAADVRAATPSHAGEMVVPRLEDTLNQIEGLKLALPVALMHRVDVATQRLKAIRESYALRHPEERVANLQQRLDDISSRLLPIASRRLDVCGDRARALAGRLESLSPLKILERGYSVTTRESDGKLIRTIEDAVEAEQIKTRVGDGTITSRVLATQ